MIFMTIRAIFKTSKSSKSKSYKDFGKSLRKSIVNFIREDLSNNEVVLYKNDDILHYDQKNYFDLDD